MDLTSLEGQPLLEVKVATAKAPREPVLIAAHTQCKVALKNQSDYHVTIPAGSVPLGFGKTGFRLLKDDDAAFDSDLDMMCEPESSDTMTRFDSNYTNLGSVVSSYVEHKNG